MIVVRALGTAQIDAGDARVKPTSVRKFAMLLHLSAECGRRVSKAELRELIFPDKSDDKARHSLRELVYELRRVGVEIETDNDGIELVAAGVRSDFGELIDRERPDASQLRAVEGGFLPGYAPTHSEAYAEWFEGFRAKSVFALCRALLKEAARAKGAGDWTMTEQAARGCLALDPMNEEATLALAEMLAVGGAKVQAIRLLDSYANEVGNGHSELTVPAALLRRRIGEKFPAAYSPARLPFAGRGREMGLLRQLLTLARTGERQFIALHGEAGIGKTRIAFELSTSAIIEGWSVVRIGMQPSDQHRPMAAFIDLVPLLLQQPGAIGCSPESMLWLRRLTTQRVGDPSGRVEDQVPRESIAVSILRAIEDVIDAIAAERPLAIHLDDFQWLDAASLGMLQSLASATASRRLVVIVTGRDQGKLESFDLSGRAFHSVDIRPLDGSARREALVNVLPRDSESSLHEWMADACGGNPFFLECLVTHFMSTGERFVVPSRLSALVDQRLSALSESARAFIVATVELGKYATLARLLRVLDLPQVGLLSAARELENAGLITVGQRVEAAHWLIVESVRHQSREFVSRLVHFRIAGVLEAEASTAQDPAIVWDCAEHWMAAGEPSRAAKAIELCARHALDIGRGREAAELYLRAAGLCENGDRQSLVKEAIRSATASSEIDIVLRASHLLEPDSAFQNGDVKLAIIAARSVLEESIVEDLPTLRACFRDSAVGIAQRLQAAITFVIACDQDRLAQTALDAADEIRELSAFSIDTQTLSSLKLQLLFHSCFGDVDEIPPIARRLLQLAGTSRIDIAADLQRKAAIGLWRAGLSAEALSTFELAHRNASDAGLQRLRFMLALMLAGLHMDIGNLVASEAWFALAGDSVPGPERDQDFFHILVASEIALARRDNVAFLKLADRAKTASLAHENHRLRRWRQTMVIFAAHLRGQQVDVESAAVVLTGSHVLRMEVGETSDLEIAVLANILRDCGQAERAVSVVHRYYSDYRRGRMPIAKRLADISAQLDLVYAPN